MTGRTRTEGMGGGDERHPFDFDPKLLGNPDGDDDVRTREWSRVYRYFDPRLRLYFRRRVAAPEVDDLMQEIWRRAVLKIGSLESSRAAWTWLSTVGVNLLRDQGRARAADARRREAFARSCEESVVEDEVLERLFEDPFEGRVDGAVFRERLAALTDEDRRLLHLFAVEERSHEEIAVVLKLASAAASRQRLRRIRQVL